MAREFVVDENRKLRDVTPSGIGTSMPIGSLMWFAAKKVPDSWLICDGRAISRTTYASLFSVIGTTFGAGDGSTTFNLPNIIDRFIEGALEAGRYIEAGLPNITGEYGESLTDSTHNGCFYGASQDKLGHTGTAVSTNSDRIGFNASLSNSIYGKSNTVQPPALTMVPCIKAFGSVAEDDTEVVARLVKRVDELRKLKAAPAAVLHLYVREDGNDANDGLSVATAVRTIARAMDIISFEYVPWSARHTQAIVHLGPGNWQETCDFAIIADNWSSVYLLGEGVDTTTVGRIRADGKTWVFVNNLTIYPEKEPSLNCLVAGPGCRVEVVGNGKVKFKHNHNNGNGISIESNAVGFVRQNAEITFEGTFYSCLWCGEDLMVEGGCKLVMNNVTAHIATVYVAPSSYTNIYAGATFSGTGVTGKKYYVDCKGILFVNGAGANKIPGTIAGELHGSGEYL